MKGEEIKISVKVQKGKEVRRFSTFRYLPTYKSFQRFFEDLKAELNAFLDEFLRR